MTKFYFWLLFLAVVIVLWFAFARPWLKQYRYTASVMTRIEAAEGSFFKQLLIWLEGLKTIIVSGIIAGYAAAKDWIDGTVQTVNGLTPTDLDPLKDQGTWHAFFADGTVTKIVAALAVASGLLALKGRLSAAKTVPKA